MKPAEYAQELGVSRQAVYAKIKRGILKSKNVEGKLYIVVDGELPSAKQAQAKPQQSSKTQTTSKTPLPKKDYKALLQAKDETIAVLKETVSDLKESNKQISTTLRGEIDLLKEAFYEMRTLYVHQLEHKQSQTQKQQNKEDEVIDVFSHTKKTQKADKEEKPHWISVKKFFKQQQITKEKTQKKVMKRLKKAYKKGDDRLIKLEDKLKINANKNYEDILD